MLLAAPQTSSLWPRCSTALSSPAVPPIAVGTRQCPTAQHWGLNDFIHHRSAKIPWNAFCRVPSCEGEVKYVRSWGNQAFCMHLAPETQVWDIWKLGRNPRARGTEKHLTIHPYPVASAYNREKQGEWQCELSTTHLQYNTPLCKSRQSMFWKKSEPAFPNFLENDWKMEEKIHCCSFPLHEGTTK